MKERYHINLVGAASKGSKTSMGKGAKGGRKGTIPSKGGGKTPTPGGGRKP